MSVTNSAIEKYGWTAVPRKVSALLSQSEVSSSAPQFLLSDFPLPDTELATKVHEYAKQELDIKTYHHSMRVFYYGKFIP